MAGNPWDQRYGQDDFFYGTEPNDFLVEQADRLPRGARVLSLAEGEGRNAVFLAGRGLRVTAVDGSARGLEKAHALARERGVALETVHADLAGWAMPEEAFEAVVSIWCHLPTPLKERVHGGVKRALVPGGVLVLEHYHPRQLEYRTGGPPDAALMDTLADLKARYEGWEVLHAEEREREVKEGTGHHGPSFVTQLVVRRPG